MSTVLNHWNLLAYACTAKQLGGLLTLPTFTVLYVAKFLFS